MEFSIPDPLRKLKITLPLSGEQDRVPTNTSGNILLEILANSVRQEK